MIARLTALIDKYVVEPVGNAIAVVYEANHLLAILIILVIAIAFCRNYN